MPVQAEIQSNEKSDKFRTRILEYLKEHPNEKTQDKSLEIGLNLSNVKVYLSEHLGDSRIFANGSNKHRTYLLK